MNSYYGRLTARWPPMHATCLTIFMSEVGAELAPFDEYIRGS